MNIEDIKDCEVYIEEQKEQYSVWLYNERTLDENFGSYCSPYYEDQRVCEHFSNALCEGSHCYWKKMPTVPHRWFKVHDYIKRCERHLSKNEMLKRLIDNFIDNIHGLHIWVLYKNNEQEII